MTLLGLDIGGTEIKAGLVDSSGRILRSASVATPGDLDTLRGTLAGVVARLATGAALRAAGVAAKGIIDAATTRVEALPGTLSFLEGWLLADLMAPLLPGTPVAADNDARAALAGELRWGAAQGRRDAVLLTLGTGVGGAVVANGRLLRGVGGVAGHFGHLTLDPDGPPCICGNHGCLETFFSARAIEAEAFAVVHRGCDTRLAELVRNGKLTCAAVFETAAAGDAQAKRIVERAARVLAAGIASLIHAYDPEAVIVGGQIAQAGEPLFAILRTEAAWRTRRLLRREVPIVPARFTAEAGLLGAAALALEAAS
ncbi:MAG: ROK family protein [Bryobacterales bacterium]|nr:ROK family protein [Bryobacteraceae bacterium]MDW8354823.1 ROK family protein [Bryobacterales bacterium]